MFLIVTRMLSRKPKISLYLVKDFTNRKTFAFFNKPVLALSFRGKNDVYYIKHSYFGICFPCQKLVRRFLAWWLTVRTLVLGVYMLLLVQYHLVIKLLHFFESLLPHLQKKVIIVPPNRVTKRIK